MEDLEGGPASTARVESHMNILVTGDGGLYRLCSGPLLDGDGPFRYGPRTAFNRDEWLYHSQNARYPACINKDLRQVTEGDLQGFDAVVHLTELSNDPLGQHNPALTYSINHLGTVALATKCKRVGITRFVYNFLLQRLRDRFGRLQNRAIRN